MKHTEEVYAFYNEMGMALAEWARLESQLEEVVARCFEFGDSALALVGVASIPQFRVKLLFADRVVAHRFAEDKARLRTWKSISTRLASLADRRNEIAHMRPTENERRAPGTRVALTQGARLERLLGDSSHVPRELFIKDVAEQRASFRRATLRLLSFADGLYGHSELPPAILEQQDRRPTIRSIEGRMREALGRQQRPSREKS